MRVPVSRWSHAGSLEHESKRREGGEPLGFPSTAHLEAMATEDALAPPVQDAVAVPDFPVKPSDRPSSKQQRYDRQLRLWASSGQSALENAHVLVVNGNATATSTLKNLVLPGQRCFDPRSRGLRRWEDPSVHRPPPGSPTLTSRSCTNTGVGRFTVLDSVAVDESDLGANFFIDPSSVGKPRAEEVVKFLLELNGDVQGEALVHVCHALLTQARRNLRADPVHAATAPLFPLRPLSLLPHPRRRCRFAFRTPLTRRRSMEAGHSPHQGRDLRFLRHPENAGQGVDEWVALCPHSCCSFGSTS